MQSLIHRNTLVGLARWIGAAKRLSQDRSLGHDDFDKPIIAIANSFTQFVPGHVHLKDLGQLVAREIEESGGVAKEFNTIAVDGCIVKTAGVESILTFSGPARVFESQDAAVEGILDENIVNAGDVIIIRYEGPKGGPGIQEMLYSTTYIKGRWRCHWSGPRR